jgi:formyl-CoA transferase
MSGWLGDIINAWFRLHSKAAATEKLLAVGLPVGPVQTAKEIFDCPQVAARKLLIDVPDPILGSVKLVGPAARLSGNAAPRTEAAPLLGQHNVEILTDLLGYTKDQVVQLKEEAVI